MEEESVASIEVTVTDVEASSIQVNDQSKDEKIKLLESENALLSDQLSSARLRLDQMEQGEEKLAALQENLAKLLSEHQLLSGVKEAYDNLSLELHCSKIKIEELEQALQSALSNAAKFEERHIEASLQAEFQTRRAEELESLLQVAELNAKFANDQNSSLREEIRALHQRILEKEESEALLISSTTLEISAKENQIILLKDNLAEMESLLKVKVSEFEEIQLKLKEEVAVKESVEANVAELTERFEKTIERCSELESELKLSTEEFLKVDAVAAEALTMNSQLEQKLMILEQLHGEVVAAEASATQRNLELQDLLRSANAAMEEARTEFEAKLAASEQRNIELQHQLTLSETRYDDADKKLKEYSLEVTELSMKLIDLEAENDQINRETQALRVQVSELELALNQSSVLRSELESEIKIFNERCVEYESKLNAIHERNLEVEELVCELELLSETQKSRINDLEQEVETLQQKCQYAETKSKEDSEMVYALTTELEKLCLAKSTLENTLQLLETKKEQMICKVKESEIKIIELESTLSQSLLLNSEFEAEVKALVNRHAEDESRINATNERNLELEELVRSYESTTEDYKRKVSELESLLEAQERRIKDLEQEIETLVQKCLSAEMKAKENADIVSALSTELQSASICIEETRLKLQESERELGATKEQNMKLEDQLIFFKSKHDDDERKMIELSVEVSQLSMKLGQMETEKEQTDYRLLELRAKISELESALSQSLVLKSELDAELKIINERCVENERRAIAAHEHNLELADLIRSSNRRADDSDRRAREIEILLETQKEQTTLQLLELRAKIAELESALSQSLVLKSELEEELKIINARCTEHEHRATVAHEHSLELEDLVQSLNSRAEDSDKRASDLEFCLETEKKRIKDLEQEIEILADKFELVEAKSKENADMVSALTIELEKSYLARSNIEISLNMITEEKLKLEEALNDSTCQILETEKLLDLLRSELHVTQGKLESGENNLKAAAIMEIELMSKLEASQVQLQQQGRLLEEANTKIIELESIKIDTDQELQILEQKLKAYEEELKQSSLKLISMERVKEELQQLLDLANDNKKDVARELAESKNTIVELINQHARSCELNSETEARLLQAQMELHATIQELTRKDLEAKTYYEEQIKIHEVKVSEISDIAEFRKIELDQYIVKVQDQENIIQALEAKFGQLEKHNGALTEGNMKLEGELAEIQSKLDDLKQKLSLALDEKDSALENFKTSMKVTEDLQQELSCERQSFQSKIASIMEEKQLLSEANTVAQKELQTFITELQKQLNEYKESNRALEAELENLKLLVTQNSSLKSRVTELTEQLLVNESQFTKEIATIMEEKQLLNEANTMAQSELVTLATRFEEQLSEYKGINEALKAKLENLATENYALQTTVKELEGLLLASESQFKKETTIMMEDKLILSEANAVAQNEVQTLITQLQEQLMVYKEINEALQSRVKELEEVLITSEVEFKKEAENYELVAATATATATREVELITSKLEQHMLKVANGNTGSDMIKKLEGEVVSAPCARIELEDDKKRKESKQGGKEKNIKVALGVALVSIVAAIVAGKN